MLTKRKSKCRICKSEYVKLSMSHKACSPSCAIELVMQANKRKEAAEARKVRAVDKVRREKLDGIKHQLNLTQSVINKYVTTKYQDMPCVACGKSPYDGVRHASHYKSRGSNSYLRFNLWNIWPCCYSCNVKKGGNIIEMRQGLVKLIGADRVEWLECAPRLRTYDIDYLKRMRAIFSKKIKRLNSMPR